MKTGISLLLFICSVVFASGGRVSGGEEQFSCVPGDWSGSPGEGADVLFIFLAFDDYVPDTTYACGDSYWNPLFEQSGTGWALNSICSSWAEPSGAPYHWNGGLGSAMDALGYSWEWFPGYTGRCGQSIPDAATLGQYQWVFVLTFDAYRSIALNYSGRNTLEAYIGTGGHVVFISQDARYSGVPETWLDEWFGTGAISQDVYSGINPFPASGTMTSFLIGWSGTALMENFSTGAGGHAEGQWWADDLFGNCCIGNASYSFASYNEVYGNVFSTYEFEACYPSEVQSICELLMEWMSGTSLERRTWGAIKTGLNQD
jgi:hypothetical protein